MAAALQQKNLAALCTFPRKHSEFRIDALLQKPVAGNARQFYFVTVGTCFLSLTHRFPLDTGIDLSDGLASLSAMSLHCGAIPGNLFVIYRKVESKLHSRPGRHAICN